MKVVMVKILMAYVDGKEGLSKEETLFTSMVLNTHQTFFIINSLILSAITNTLKVLDYPNRAVK